MHVNHVRVIIFTEGSKICLSEVNAYFYTMLCTGMKYLHQQKMMHRDLKSSNGNSLL